MDTNGIAETVDASVPDMLDHFFRAYDTVLMKKEIFQKRTFLSGQRKGKSIDTGLSCTGIKACPSNYHVLTGVHADPDGIRETAGWLLDGHLDYEFRTTVVRELHSEKDFQEISRWLSGAKAYYLQAYRDSDGVLMPGFSACSEKEMKNYRDILSQTIPVVEIRGMEL